jgi:hypothetical protein
MREVTEIYENDWKKGDSEFTPSYHELILPS